VQQVQAVARRQEEKEKKAMKLATVRIEKNSLLPKGTATKLSIEKIVQEVNDLCDSN